MKRNMNHCMWHSNKGPQLHSTSVCLYKSPMCRNYTCSIFFSGLKGFCCAALRGSPVFTILWNHLQTLHLMGQSWVKMTDPWSTKHNTRQVFSILLPDIDYPLSSGWLCHIQLNLSETGPLDVSSPAGVPMSFTGISLHSRVCLIHPTPYLQVWFCTLETRFLQKTLRSDKHFQQSGRV